VAQSTVLRQTSPELAPRPVILVVEADPDTQALYGMLFPAERYALEICDDGAEALGRAICQPPDLILTEARIRRIDGFALSQLLRADPATRHVPIVMVTSATSNAERTRALRAADVVISKPFDLDELTASVQRILAAGRRDGAARLQEPASDGFALDANRTGRPRRLCMSRRLQRQWTTSPPLTPPSLRCPSCDTPLLYQRSHVGGVSERAVEQWDYFACARCGPFQYRHRTRKLKRAV
jgi:CheY-like chemotaxis protein